MATRTNHALNTARPIEIRNGIALYEDGSRRAYRPVEIRSNTAAEKIGDDGSKSRTVDLVWTTGAPVLRYSWSDDELYSEELVVTEEAIKLDRLRNGASVLDSHDSSELEDVIGNVQEVRIENGIGFATIRISNRASCDELWQDIKDGIIRHISVGYAVLATETKRADGQMTVREVTSWEPYEISFVAIPADAGCTVRNQPSAPLSTRETEIAVTISANNDPLANPIAGNDNELRAAQAQSASLRRELDIRSYGARMNVPADEVNTAVEDTAMTVQRFMDANIDKIAERAKETSVTTIRTSVTLDSSPEEELNLRGQAFAARTMSDYGFKAPVLSERASQFTGDASMRSIAIGCIRASGGNVNERASDKEIVNQAIQTRSFGGAVSSTDLGAVLGNVVKAVLDQSYEKQIVETDYESWAGSTSVRDFKVNKAVHVGMLTGIGPVAEGGQLPLAGLGSAARYFALGTRGLKVSFTREAIVNDEFGVLLQAVGKLGMLFKHDEQAIAVRALNLGKMTTDAGDQDIFAPANHNVITAAALDQDALDKAVQELSKQRIGNVDGVGTGLRISIKPKKLLVSSDLYVPALRLTTPIMANQAGQVNPIAAMGLEVIPVADLPSKTAYLAGSSALSDVIQVARLAGAQGPQIEKLPPVTLMAVEWEAFNDFTAFGVGITGIVKINIA